MAGEDSIAEWRISIISRLEHELPRAVADPLDRTLWVVRHLEEYIDRWVGFVEHPAVAGEPNSFVFDSGLFAVIGVAIEVLNEEISKVNIPTEARERWNALVALHTNMHRARDVSSRHRLHQLGSELYTKLSTR
jgi:hypothetical protein